MKKKYLFLFIYLFTILIFSDTVEIKVMKTRLVSKPDFLSSTITYLKNGDQLEVVKETENWLFVKTAKKIKGFIHKSSVKTSKAKLSGIIPGKKGTSKKEIALAAKGFSEGNEKRIKGNRKAYNFNDLNWVMNRRVSIAALIRFIQIGGLK